MKNGPDFYDNSNTIVSELSMTVGEATEIEKTERSNIEKWITANDKSAGQDASDLPEPIENEITFM